MTFAPETLREMLDAPFDTVIDVRAPSEFARDHVPGAVNLPVLDDGERARVGTIYKQESPFLARKIGAALVARNAARHIETTLAARGGGWRPLLYCWRGGQRSGSFASILSQIGWRVAVLAGGYRHYRGLVKHGLYDVPFPAPIVLLDGYTGTAKTDLLQLVAARGGQIIDLEGLANHRGSVLGALGKQPTQTAFETALSQAIVEMDPGRPVLIEAESSKVGQRIVPPSLWRAMRDAPRIRIDAPVAARARYLRETYADLTAYPDAIAARLQALVPLQGRARVAHWCDLARAGAHLKLATDLIERHYDPRYRKGAKGADTIFRTDSLDDDALNRLADRIAGCLGTMTG